MIRRGFAGYNTQWINTALPGLLKANKYQLESPSDPEFDAVIVFLGANDSCMKPPQNASTETYGQNLKAIITQFNTTCRVPFDKIIVVTPPALHDDMYEAFSQASFGVPRSRHNAITKTYVDVAVSTAEALGCKLLNLWEAMMKYDSPETPYGGLLVDGLHLSPAGGLFLGKHLVSLLEPMLSHIVNVGPQWRMINHADPAATFSSPPAKN